jgi:hypothetical protein
MAGVGVQRDRILACIGMTGIPAAGRAGRTKTGIGAPGKSSRAVFAFLCPRPPLGDFTKEMRLNFGAQHESGRQWLGGMDHFADRSGSRTLPHRRIVRGRVCVSRFLRSQPRRIGLGHPRGRDPSRIIDNGHRPTGEPRTYNGSRYWPLVCTMTPRSQASLMAS